MSNQMIGLGRIALALVTVVVAAPVRAQPPSAEVLAAKSSFVFRGTVVQLGASTATIPKGSNTAVVHVDDVLDAAPDMPRLKGSDVTVRLLDPKALKAGAQRIFFTQPYSFGQTVGVDETGSLPATNQDQVAKEIKAARQKAAEAALATRLSSAEAVVLARVADIGPEQQKPHNSEHDPDWRTATLAPVEVLKGKPPERAAFAQSRDVMWVAAPKLARGDEAIYLLQRNPSKDFPTSELVIVHPLDVQDKAQLDRVKKLLAGGRRTR